MYDEADDYTIQSILRKNRLILKKHYPQGKICAHQLAAEGFVFMFHTHYRSHDESGELFPFVYEYGLKEIDNQYRIIKMMPE
jgi:hypothetical protein